MFLFSMMLVQALMLTIPPGIMTSMNAAGGFWDELQKLIAGCNIDDSGSVWIHNIWFPMWNMVLGGLICNVLGIVMGVVYYVMRPKDKAHFLHWWRSRGLYGAIMCFSALVAGAATTMLLLILYMVWLVPTDYLLCDMVQAAMGPYSLIATSPFMKQAVALVVCLAGGSFITYCIVLF
jgi:uncharacterized membrane protein